MNRVEEIEAAIDSLPTAEYQRIVEWFREREQNRWDIQLDGDSVGGKLDFLFDEADKERRQGQRQKWPPPVGAANLL